MARAASVWVSVRGSPPRSASSLHPPGMRSRCSSSAGEGRASSSTRAIAASANASASVLARVPRLRRRRALVTGWRQSLPHGRMSCSNIGIRMRRFSRFENPKNVATRASPGSSENHTGMHRQLSAQFHTYNFRPILDLVDWPWQQ